MTNVSGKSVLLVRVASLPEDGVERNGERRDYVAHRNYQFQRDLIWDSAVPIPSRLFWSKSIRPLLCPVSLAMLECSVGSIEQCYANFAHSSNHKLGSPECCHCLVVTHGPDASRDTCSCNVLIIHKRLLSSGCRMLMK